MTAEKERNSFSVMYLIFSVIFFILFLCTKNIFLLYLTLILMSLLPVALLWSIKFPNHLETPQMVILGFSLLSLVSILEIIFFSFFYEKYFNTSHFLAFYTSAQYYFSTGDIPFKMKKTMPLDYAVISVSESLLGYIYAIGYLSFIIYGISNKTHDNKEVQTMNSDHLFRRIKKTSSQITFSESLDESTYPDRKSWPPDS